MGKRDRLAISDEAHAASHERQKRAREAAPARDAHSDGRGAAPDGVTPGVAQPHGVRGGASGRGGRGGAAVFIQGYGSIAVEQGRGRGGARWGAGGRGGAAYGGGRGGARWGAGGRGGAAHGGGLEPCWICGSTEHRRRDCPHKLDGNDGKSVQRKLICLGCRKRGHILAECPDAGAAAGLEAPKVVCYNCGSAEHRLHQCTEPKLGNGLSFASCFICSQSGHLSKDCPSNTRGLYPRGGGCKVCGSTAHLVKDCPTATADVPATNAAAAAAAEAEPAPAPVAGALTSHSKLSAVTAAPRHGEKSMASTGSLAGAVGGDDLDTNVSLAAETDEAADAPRKTAGHKKFRAPAGASKGKAKKTPRRA